MLAAVSFVSSGVEVLQGCLDRRELQCGSPLRPIALQLDEIKYFYFSLNEPIKPEENMIDAPLQTVNIDSKPNQNQNEA